MSTSEKRQYDIENAPMPLGDVPLDLEAKEIFRDTEVTDSHVDPDAPTTRDTETELEAAIAWRPANSLLVLRQQVNAKWPNRDKDSDGMIGDVHHCGGGAPSSSDHCAWVRDGSTGVVTAFDITHDPSNCDASKLVDALLASRDPRIKYMIYSRKIVASYAVGGTPAWVWRNYNGSNPHTKHMHLSVNSTKTGAGGYDNESEWTIESPSV